MNFVKRFIQSVSCYLTMMMSFTENMYNHDPISGLIVDPPGVGVNAVTAANTVVVGAGGGVVGGGGGSHRVDMLEIPGKGRCYVYFARYTYDPLSQSLNDNPQSELYVSAGDYILVWGECDEDGFYEGELLDGRKG